MNTAPKLVESIPIVSAPVRLPKLAPSEASYRAGVITGAVLIVVDVVGLVLGIAVFW